MMEGYSLVSSPLSPFYLSCPSSSCPIKPLYQPLVRLWQRRDCKQRNSKVNWHCMCMSRTFTSLQGSPVWVSLAASLLVASLPTSKIFTCFFLGWCDSFIIQALRKQYRYMSHLPLTCEFVICELDIKPPVVSRGTLNFFRGEPGL